MDSLTQIILGAAVGEAVIGKKAGNKAILWGAVAGTIPDLDVLSKHFVDEVTALEMHRGFTHSIVFSLVFAPVFAFFVRNYERIFLSLFFVAMMAVFFLSNDGILAKGLSLGVLGLLLFGAYKLKASENVTTWDWTKLMFWSLITHPFLDAHTTWGTQLFWPSEWRVAYKNIFVADPIYTLPFLVFLLIAVFSPKGSSKRRKFNNLGLIVSSGYMVLTLGFKAITYFKFVDSLKAQQIEYKEIRTRPTPLNSVLWSAHVETEDSYLIGFYSLLDNDDDIEFASYKKNHEALGRFSSEDKVQRMIKIARQWYTVQELGEDSIRFNDLRFGLIGMGEGRPFAFQYTMYYDADNHLQLIEGDKPRKGFGKMMGDLWQRMLGNKNP